MKLLPVSGVSIGIAAAGIKYQQRNDLVLFKLASGGSVAATFTRNAFCAAPVVVARRHLEQYSPHYLLVNSGNANAGTGKAGIDDALACCRCVAEHSDCRQDEVLPFSTGVIGEALPLERIERAIPQALAALSEESWQAAAEAIMTTDTRPKGLSRQFSVAGEVVTITGIAKGSGMIRPDMATMLAYVATDATIEQSLLQQELAAAVATSFNRISVDGDTSTNDACVLMASGQSTVELTAGGEALGLFRDALAEVCGELARSIVADGEGATKLITVAVEGGRDESECEQVAFTIAHSPLVKTAFFASDPNWGRILAAVGRAGLYDLDIERVDIYLDHLPIVRAGGRDSELQEADAAEVMARDAITIRVVLGRGSATAQIWTCDLSYDYVRINAEYRT